MVDLPAKADDHSHMRLSRETIAPEDVYVLQSQAPATPWGFPAHLHDGWCELQFLAEGRLTQQVNGRSEDLIAGDLLLIRRDDEHVLHGQGFVLFNLLVPDSEWSRLAAYLGEPNPLTALATAPRPPRLHLLGAARERLEASLRELFARQRSSDARTRLARVLIDLLPRLAGSTPPAAEVPAAPASAPPWLHALLDDLDGLLEHGIDTRALAERANVSAEHFARTIRRHLAVTPTELLNRRRLERAALLLTHSDRPILNIAMDLGFGSASVFSRLFRARHALAPREWRRRHGVDWRS